MRVYLNKGTDPLLGYPWAVFKPVKRGAPGIQGYYMNAKFINGRVLFEDGGWWPIADTVDIGCLGERVTFLNSGSGTCAAFLALVKAAQEYDKSHRAAKQSKSK